MRNRLLKCLLICPALASSTLLTSCNGVTVKEPSFSHYENEIAATDYKRASATFEELFSKGMFSFTSTASYSSSQKTLQSNVLNANAPKKTTNIAYSNKKSLKVDNDHETAQRKTVSKGKEDYTSLSALNSSLMNLNATTNYQIEAVNGYNHLIEINKKSRIYSAIHVINDGFRFKHGARDLFDIQYQSFLALESDVLDAYIAMDSSLYDELNIKCYLDETVYTCTCYLKKSSSSSLMESETEIDIILQYDFTNSMTAKFSKKTTTTRTFATIGDKTTINESKYFDSSFKQQKTSVSRVNIYKYDRVLGGVEHEN